MSDPNDASPPAAMKVERATRVDPHDVRFATPPSPGSAFLLACLSGRRVVQLARRELLDRHAANADPALGEAIATARHAIDGEQRAADGDDSYLCRIARRLEINIPPSPRGAAPAAGLEMLAYLMPRGQEDPTTMWLSEIARAVRPRLMTPALEAAWHSGEAARFVAVCIGLESTIAALRLSAPHDAEIRSHAEEIARERAESIATLKARLEATSLPFVVAQARHLARPDGVAPDVHAFLSEVARAFDGCATGAEAVQRRAPHS